MRKQTSTDERAIEDAKGEAGLDEYQVRFDAVDEMRHLDFSWLT